MREDMAQVIVERPRVPDGGTRKGRARPPEDLPSHQGMRRPHRLAGNWKQLNENLSPLRRYLEKQVGRPWNKVYSEIAARLRVTSTVQQHVRDHLRDFVALHPYLPKSGQLWHPPLYVDPSDGILKRVPASGSDRVALAPDRELRRLGGFWYEVRLAPLPDPVYRTQPGTRTLRLKRFDRNSPAIEIEVIVRHLASPGVVDAVTGRLVPLGPEFDDPESRERYRRDYPDRRYAIAKRQLSRAELRRHGLENDRAD